MWCSEVLHQSFHDSFMLDQVVEIEVLGPERGHADAVVEPVCRNTLEAHAPIRVQTILDRFAVREMNLGVARIFLDLLDNRVQDRFLGFEDLQEGTAAV